MTTAYGATSSQAPREQCGVEIGGSVHDRAPVGQGAGFLDGRRLRVSVLGAERLPFQGEQSMTLEVAEGAVIREHVEAIARPLEGTPRLVPPVGPIANVRAKQTGAVVARHPSRHLDELIVGEPRDRVKGRRHDLHFPFRVKFGERHLGSRLRRNVANHRPCG